MGNSTILEVCKKKNIARYIYASSLYVFSKYGGFYKATKQSCELLIQEYNKNYKIPFTIIRFGSLYGPGAGRGNAIYDLISMAYKNRSINYWGQGNEIRQYIHARDAAKICEQISLFLNSLDPSFIVSRIFMNSSFRVLNFVL